MPNWHLMEMTDEYDGVVNGVAGRIRSTLPAYLVETFATSPGIKAIDFIPCNPVPCGEVCTMGENNFSPIVNRDKKISF